MVSQTVGMVEVEAQLDECFGKLQFHVTSGRVQYILGYSGLKAMGLLVECQDDCLHNKSGKKILCHAVKVIQVTLYM